MGSRQKYTIEFSTSQRPYMTAELFQKNAEALIKFYTKIILSTRKHQEEPVVFMIHIYYDHIKMMPYNFSS